MGEVGTCGCGTGGGIREATMKNSASERISPTSIWSPSCVEWDLRISFTMLLISRGYVLSGCAGMV